MTKTAHLDGHEFTTAAPENGGGRRAEMGMLSGLDWVAVAVLGIPSPWTGETVAQRRRPGRDVRLSRASIPAPESGTNRSGVSRLSGCRDTPRSRRTPRVERRTSR